MFPFPSDLTINQFLDFELLRWGTYRLTPGNLVSALLVLLLTWTLLTGFRQFLKRQETRGRLDAATAYTFYQLFRYFIVVMALVLGLEALGVQLNILLASTAALFVGIGLGLQDLFHDFIAGIVLLIDRTVKVGDVIQVDDTVGRVVRIGTRLTELETRDHVHLLVPNSHFTRNTVANWTRQPDLTRFEVTVGVSYESDPRQVEALLLRCAGAHEQILATPPPQVWFVDFADSALVFRLLFYSADVFRIERVRSDLRFLIFDTFRAHNVTIPFPQRDLHIRSVNTF